MTYLIFIILFAIATSPFGGAARAGVITGLQARDPALDKRQGRPEPPYKWTILFQQELCDVEETDPGPKRTLSGYARDICYPLDYKFQSFYLLGLEEGCESK
jgi:hypothetical protein